MVPTLFLTASYLTPLDVVVLGVCKIDFSSKVQQRKCKIQGVVVVLNVLDHTGRNL